MIGRQKERSQLLEAFASEDSEFIAVYGRRRVGKTFLVRETFNQSFTFQHTGVKNGSRQIQLSRFRQSAVKSLRTSLTSFTRRSSSIPSRISPS